MKKRLIKKIIPWAILTIIILWILLIGIFGQNCSGGEDGIFSRSNFLDKVFSFTGGIMSECYSDETRIRKLFLSDEDIELFDVYYKNGVIGATINKPEDYWIDLIESSLSILSIVKPDEKTYEVFVVDDETECLYSIDGDLLRKAHSGGGEGFENYQRLDKKLSEITLECYGDGF